MNGDAASADFLYMDPPYLGTSIGRDKRYAHQLGSEELVTGLRNLRERSLRFALSYDGMTGDKVYGPPLPEELGLTRLLLHAGTSSQATLSGLRKGDTIESLYMSPGLAEKIHQIQSSGRKENSRGLPSLTNDATNELGDRNTELVRLCLNMIKYWHVRTCWMSHVNVPVWFRCDVLVIIWICPKTRLAYWQLSKFHVWAMLARP